MNDLKAFFTLELHRIMSILNMNNKQIYNHFRLSENASHITSQCTHFKR